MEKFEYDFEKAYAEALSFVFETKLNERYKDEWKTTTFHDVDGWHIFAYERSGGRSMHRTFDPYWNSVMGLATSLLYYMDILDGGNVNVK